MHLQLIVRDGVDRLLTYVPAFQTSFMQEISRFDPRFQDWLFSVSWQFQNLSAAVSSSMPDPAVWAGGAPLSTTTPAPASAAPAAGTATAAPAPVDRTGDDEVLDDLRALYAIRDAALGRPAPTGPAGEPDFQSTRPGTDLDPPGLPHGQPRQW